MSQRLIPGKTSERLLDDRIGVQTKRVCRLGIVGSKFIEPCAREIRRTRGGGIMTSETLQKTRT